jgi:hypothetical protein
MGYLMLIAKYMWPWGDLGKEWNRRAAERRRRAYDASGMPLETIELKRACVELPV